MIQIADFYGYIGTVESLRLLFMQSGGPTKEEHLQLYGYTCSLVSFSLLYLTYIHTCMYICTVEY